MSKRAAITTLVESSHEALYRVDTEMIHLLETIEGPEPITPEGHEDSLRQVRMLARSLELQAQMGRALARAMARTRPC